MAKRLKAALIGAGWSANTIATAAKSVKNLAITGISNHNVDKARSLAGKHGIPMATAEYKEFLESKDFDLVIVSLPHHLHYPVALEALQAGKHVLVEKPMTVTVEQGTRLVEEARERGLKLGTWFQQRFTDSTRKARELLDEDRLGKVLHARVEVFLKRDVEYFSNSSWRGKWAMEGGSALINQGIHELDRAIFLLGDLERACGFYGHLFHDIETEDNAVAAFTFKSGVFGTMQVSIAIKAPVFTGVTIHGTEGSLFVDQNRVILHHEGNKPEIHDYREIRGMDAAAIKQEAHQRLMSSFVTSILEGREPPVNGEEGLRAIKAIQAIYQSMGKRPVLLT